jgi:hypothetical protein
VESLEEATMPNTPEQNNMKKVGLLIWLKSWWS